jgi:hypothetical protein
MSLRHRARRRSAATATVVALTSVIGTLLGSAPADAAVPTAPVTLPAAIEPMPAYQPQSFCDPVDKPGVVAFGRLLTATYPHTSVVDISRSCGSERGTSEHKDGRALDWGVNVANATQRGQAQSLLRWLFAPDAAGDPHAMLRRLGIMYVIWNKHIWGAWSGRWEPYACSGVTACHMDHMHFSFDWAGARKLTSFWTGVVAAPTPAPRYLYTSRAFPQVVSVSSRRAGVTTPFALLAGAHYRFTVAGTYRTDAVATDRADAECSTHNGVTWTDRAPADASTSTGLLDLSVGNHRYWRPVVDTGTGCNRATHTYVRTLTFPTTAPVRLAVNDPDRSDDAGSLTVTVQRVG